MLPLADCKNGTNWHVRFYFRKDENSIDMNLLYSTLHVVQSESYGTMCLGCADVGSSRYRRVVFPTRKS